MLRSCNYTPIWCNRNFSATVDQSIDARDDITIDVLNTTEYLKIIKVIMVQGLQEKFCSDRKIILGASQSRIFNFVIVKVFIAINITEWTEVEILALLTLSLYYIVYMTWRLLYTCTSPVRRDSHLQLQYNPKNNGYILRLNSVSVFTPYQNLPYR